MSDNQPCACGNTFIECFGIGKSWWVGCKPCGNHVHAKSRIEAQRKWKHIMPVPTKPDSSYQDAFHRERELCCSEWTKGIAAINDVTLIAHVHGADYVGPVFKFCPWCGKKRTDKDPESFL